MKSAIRDGTYMRRGRFQTRPYDIVPQKLRLFLDEFLLANRCHVRSVYLYHITPICQSIYIANRIVGIYLCTINDLSQCVYNLNFGKCFRRGDVEDVGCGIGIETQNFTSVKFLKASFIKTANTYYS